MLKKAFGKKKTNKIRESSANKLSSRTDSSIVRVGDKAIKADKKSIKQIHKYIEEQEAKGQEVNVDEVLVKIDVDYGDGQGAFKVLDIIKDPKRNVDMLSIIQPNLLRLEENLAIKGSPVLIQRAFEYAQKNPGIVDNPERLIEMFDEPIVTSVDEEEVVVEYDEEGDKIEKSGVSGIFRPKKTETFPQLHIVRTTILDEDVEDEDVSRIRTVGLRQKYHALGTLIRSEIPFVDPSFFDRIDKERKDIDELVDTSIPRTTTSVGFTDYTVRKPNLDAKFNIFPNTVNLSKVQKPLPKSVLKRAESAKEKSQGRKIVRVQKGDHSLDDKVSSDLRDMVKSELMTHIGEIFDGVKEEKDEIIEVESSSLPEYQTRQTFFTRRIQEMSASGEIVPQEDDVGKNVLNEYNFYRDAYVRLNADDVTIQTGESLEEWKERVKTTGTFKKEEVLSHMTSIVEWKFKQLYPVSYAVLPIVGTQYMGFYDMLVKVPEFKRKFYLERNVNVPHLSKFEIALRRHLERNMKRLVASTDYNVLLEHAQRGLIDSSRLEKKLYEEIRNFIRDNINLDMSDFFVGQPIPQPTQDQIDQIENEWKEFDRIQEETLSEQNAEELLVLVDEGNENRKENAKFDVFRLEDKIFKELDENSVAEYLFSVAEVLQYLRVNTSKKNTVGPYAVRFRERIYTGDLLIESLNYIDPLLALPEFSLNKNVSSDSIEKFVEYSQYVTANDLMNMWVKSQTTFRRDDDVWFDFPKKSSLDPENSAIDVEKMCGATENTVFVKEGGKIVCKPRSEVAEKIDILAKSNGDSIKEILK